MESNPKNVTERNLSLKTKGIQLAFFWIIYVVLLALNVLCIIDGANGGEVLNATLDWTIVVITSLWVYLFAFIFCAGFKIVKPLEARVFTLFGKYYGTLKSDGIFYVNPFVTAINVPKESMVTGETVNSAVTATVTNALTVSNKLSLKIRTFTNDKQKINDKLGNPLIVGMVVTWRVADTAKAMFAVDNFADFLSLNCDSSLRDIVKKYPYDSTEGSNTTNLRDGAEEISAELQSIVQERVLPAGLEIIAARITNISYAPEIAAAMLQRQQASAIVDARTLIVDGAVGMVRLALEKLKEEGVVELDEERKAAMVSNLMVVLCGDKGAQPIINSGSLY
jgi:regulator of protease activity HflC (stomatin/prohibitin superfamily)